MVRRLLTVLLAALLLTSCAAGERPPDGAGPVNRMPLRYADRFAVDYDAEGRALVTIGDDRFLVLPEGAPEREEPGAAVLRLPLRTVYCATSSAMDLIARLDALDTVRLTGTKRESWTLPEVARAMDEGALRYAGKYSAPDYELLLAEGAALAIENTMIYHSPETKEQLEELGIPVLVERSSYESHPLGRLEWIKLYGLLTGKTAEAEAFFDEQSALAEAIFARESTGKTAAFFFLTANGGVNVRCPEDYVAKMIELAGGVYALADLEIGDAGARATMNLQMERFYADARDADVLFYNAAIDGGVDTVAQLLEKGEWLADFRAVQSGNVWCTEADLFQRTSGIAAMIDELHRIFSGTADDAALQYFHRLK
jgi:iron complex transport system substrate-binding protein